LIDVLFIINIYLFFGHIIFLCVFCAVLKSPTGSLHVWGLIAQAADGGTRVRVLSRRSSARNPFYGFREPERSLGLTKNSVKTMNQEEAAFTYLREKFPRLSAAKLKEGIFIGPQIRDLIKDEYFNKLLQGDEKAAWDSFKFVVKGFLENRRAQNYEDLVNNLLQSYQKLGCNTSLKILFLHSHLGSFPEN
jgi:hypothetical protein